MAEETTVDPVTLELEASKAEARDLARRLEELNRRNFQNEPIFKAHQKRDQKKNNPK